MTGTKGGIHVSSCDKLEKNIHKTQQQVYNGWQIASGSLLAHKQELSAANVFLHVTVLLCYVGGQRVPSNAKEGGDVGVVCHLSLNTKVGKLETETKRLKR